jgi:hypothetical protein
MGRFRAIEPAVVARNIDWHNPQLALPLESRDAMEIRIGN